MLNEKHIPVNEENIRLLFQKHTKTINVEYF